MATYATKINQALRRLGSNGTSSPDTSNTGTVLANLFLWNEVTAYAGKRVKAAKKELREIADIDELSPGNHVVLDTSHFALTVNVSQPVRQFDPDVLVEALAKHRISKSVALQMIEDAKVPTTSRRTIKVLERS